MDNITLEKPPKLPKLRDADFDVPQFSDDSDSESSLSDSSSSSSESSESSDEKEKNRKIYNDLMNKKKNDTIIPSDKDNKNTVRKEKIGTKNKRKRSSSSSLSDDKNKRKKH